jgi:hypothetical protein
MPLSDDDVHMILLGISAVTLIIVSIILIAVLHKSENYDNYGKLSDQKNTFRNKDLIRKYEFGTQDAQRQQIILNLAVHPDYQLRQQIDDNFGQLERLKVLIEQKLFSMIPDKEFHIRDIRLKPSVDRNNFVVDGKTYPKNTYALFHFRRPDNKTQAYVNLTSEPGFGAGAEELIYSDIIDELKKPNSPMNAVL